MEPSAKSPDLERARAGRGAWRAPPGRFAPGDTGDVVTERRVAIGREADLVEARRAMRELAAATGFEDSGCVLLTLVASELARNIVHCSRHGELVLRTVGGERGDGIEVIATEDPSDAAALATGSSLGISLAGIERLMDEFSTALPEGGGRTIRARKWLPSVLGRAAQRTAMARDRAAARLGGALDGQRLEAQYGAALHEFMERPSERALSRVYTLARDAMTGGLGLLDLAALHRQALDAAPLRPGRGGEAAAASLHLAHDLFAEALAPFARAPGPAVGGTAVAAAAPAAALASELQRVARALHDEVQQQLVLVALSLDDLRRSAPAALAPRIEYTLRQIDEVSDRVRTLSHELRPRVLDDLGLMAALDALANGVARRHGLAIAVAGSTGGRVAAAAETALYRVAQEALANVVRHAAATRADLRVERGPGRLRLTVQDDGRGVDPDRAGAGERAGLGLRGMQERLATLGGVLCVESRPGEGTRVGAVVPVPDAEERPSH